MVAKMMSGVRSSLHRVLMPTIAESFTSPPGGNKVDGLPPASSLFFLFVFAIIRNVAIDFVYLYFSLIDLVRAVRSRLVANDLVVRMSRTSAGIF